MTHCFLFAHYLNAEGCLSLVLDQYDNVKQAPVQRTFNEIKALQQNSKTIVIAAAQQFSLHKVALPWLAEKKARAAIPFALEDKLAQGLEKLHFAFDRHHYQHDHYLVTVCAKSYVADLISRLDEHGINFDAITLAWFALQGNEIAVLPDFIAVNHEPFQGALSQELMNEYFNNLTSKPTIYRFRDSKEITLPTHVSFTPIDEISFVWLAKRLQHTQLINLCQGEFQHNSSLAKTKTWYKAALVMFLLWLITLFAVNLLKLHMLNQHLAKVNAQISVIYRQFFPQAKQVINPRFRISQLLKSNKNNSDRTLWMLLSKLAEAFKQHQTLTLEELRFQNQALQVTLISYDFAELEKFETRLQQTQVQVKQTQAFTRDKWVVGTMELSL